MNDQAKKLRQMIDGDRTEAKTISVVSGKGGVGKSNTALNFALQLTARQQKVLLIDLDIGMGNIDILVGNDATYSIANLFYDFLPISDIIELGPNNLSYIAGGSSLEQIVQLENKALQFFFDQFNDVVHKYDYIIFDLGAGVTEASMSFILASDECLVITTPEPTAITDAYSMMKHVLKQDETLPISVIINRCKTEKEGKQTMNKFAKVIEHFLHKKVIPLGMLPEDKIVSTSVIKQIPYTILDEHAPISKAMYEIVHRYVTNNTVHLNSWQKKSFIHTLKKFIVKG